MRYRLAIAAVMLQVLALGYMAGQREWILRAGRTVLLRTAPVDPNDPMRGEYVRLEYDISQVRRDRLEGGLAERYAGPPAGRRMPEQRVYARLAVDEDGLAEMTGLTDEKPPDGLFLRGFAQNSYGRTVRVRYGIEALFMEQGSARKLEGMRFTERPGVPLDIEVAVSSGGVAVLKDYRWEPLGITLAFERAPAPPRTEAGAPGPAQPPQFITGVTVELKNYGPDDVAIVDLPKGGSLRLVPDERWQEARYRWVGEERAAPVPEAAQVVVLKAGQTHRMKVDLTDPAWHVVATLPTANLRPIPLRDVADPWSASFRLEYTPPSKASVAGLPNAHLIRHGRLRSRAFNPTAALD